MGANVWVLGAGLNSGRQSETAATARCWRTKMDLASAGSRGKNNLVTAPSVGRFGVTTEGGD